MSAAWNMNIDGAAAVPPRLKPDMASFSLLVLAFVREYIGNWGASPSYGEIAHALDTNRERVRQSVKQLIRSGALLRTPGERALVLPEARDEALRILQGLGYSVGLTIQPLPVIPLFDYPYGEIGGDGQSGEGAKKQGESQSGGRDQEKARGIAADQPLRTRAAQTKRCPLSENAPRQVRGGAKVAGDASIDGQALWPQGERHG